ncbi:MAG: hypothetical protein JWN77_435 [Frankiales bacterium]|jgi:hypothetical protein|nr:hypothetical protein [Frankiales bacterium]
MRRLPLAVAGVVALGLTLATAAVSPAAPALPAAVEFSASIPADMQRDEGEPEVSVDPAGNIYTCGPSGFSNIADYAQVSRDGGDQFHLLGQAPRGQISTGEGGGDCGLASAPVKNQLGQYTWAYTGLGPLTNFSTGTADDTGKTLHGSAVSESVPGVDRQWLVFTDAKTVFLNYNQLAAGFVVQKSTDGGYSYGPRQVVATGGGRIGPMRAITTGDAKTAVVYFPYNRGNKVALAVSTDGGTTFGNCIVGDAEVSPLAGFLTADHDKAGNIFVTYAEKGGGRDVYVMPVLANKVKDCKGDAVVGTGKKILVNRGKTITTVMPWIVASGAPGRFAVAYYGTDQDGDPDKGTFKGAWYVHVGMTLDAFAANPDVMQIQASSHPTHYDSICLNGTLCAAPPEGDRTLVDYFAMDLNPADGRLNIVYNNAAKKPNELLGHVGLAVVMTQMSGPSLLGTTLTPKRARTRQVSSDPGGDALSPYGNLCAAPPQVPCPAPSTANQPAGDFADKNGNPAVEIGPEVDLKTGTPVADGGFTVTMRVKDLSQQAKLAAATSAGGSSLLYLFRWNNGYQPSGATARWSPVTGWSFAYDGYETASTESGQADPTAEKIIVYPGTNAIAGDADEDGGVIRMSVPRRFLKTLGRPDDKNRPSEVAATKGSLLTSAAAYSLVNIGPDARLQSYLYPMDNAPAMDFRVGAAAAAVQPPTVLQPGTDPTAPGGTGTDTGTIPSTGGLGAPLLALVLTAVALTLARLRRRRA